MCGESFILPEYTCTDIIGGAPCTATDIAITNQDDPSPLFDIENLIYLYK